MTEPCDEDPDELPPGAPDPENPHLHLQVTAQRCCPTIIAAAHALYYHRGRIGGAAEREAQDLMKALDDLVMAADFLTPTVRAADYVEIRTSPAGVVPLPDRLLDEPFITGGTDGSEVP